MGQRNTPKKELRKSPRVDLHLKADYRIVLPNKEDDRIEIETENISLGGLMFYSDRSIKMGTKLKVRLFLEKELAAFIAKVVWMEKRENSPVPKSPFATGLQYFEISETDLEKINRQAARVIRLQPPPKTR